MAPYDNRQICRILAWGFLLLHEALTEKSLTVITEKPVEEIPKKGKWKR
jgi:hypothetical protein